MRSTSPESAFPNGGADVFSPSPQDFRTRFSFRALALPLLVYAVGVLIFTAWSYNRKRQDILSGIDKRLLQTAQTVRFILPPDFHDRAVSADAVSRTEDMKNLTALTQFAKSVDVTFLRSLVFHDSSGILTSSNVTDEEITANRLPNYWDPFPAKDTPTLMPLLASGEPIISTLRQETRTYRSALIPEVSPSGNPYIAVASIDLEQVQAALYRQIPVSLMEGVFFLGLAGPLAIRLYHLISRHRTELAQALIEAEKAQLEMLRYQLNPHFLFNTLNSIQYLIPENPPLASKMVLMMANFCRASLFRRGEQWSTLDAEMRLVEEYLEIEKVRWGDTLLANVDTPAEARTYRLIPFLLQPLVENAVKYGQMAEVTPLQIRVCGFPQESELVLEVRNTGHWIEAGDHPPGKISTKVGLENLKKRLAKNYGSRARLERESREGWVIMRLIVPVIEKEEAPHV
jgi:hypothetical protein